MALRYLAGQYFNALERGTVTVTSSDSLYPATALYDGLTNRPWKLSAVATDATITVDGNVVANGTLDTWAAGNATGWTKVLGATGTIVQTSVAGEMRTGSAAKLTFVADNVTFIQDIVVPAGSWWTLDGWARGDATAAGRIRIFNRDTNKFWDPVGGTWTASTTDLGAIVSTVYTQIAKTFQVEPISTTITPTVTLRIQLVLTSVGSAYFDDVYLYPSFNFASIHGWNNVQPRLTVTLRSSIDAFAASDTQEATLALADPSCYGLTSARVDRRYSRIKLAGTSTVVPAINEIVIGVANTLSRHAVNPASRPWQLGLLRRQVRADVLSEPYIYNLESRDRRTLKLPMLPDSTTAYAELLQEIRARCDGGAYPAVIVPDDTETMVLFCRVDSSWDVRRTFDSPWRSDFDLMLAEQGFGSSAA